MAYYTSTTIADSSTAAGLLKTTSSASGANNDKNTSSSWEFGAFGVRRSHGGIGAGGYATRDFAKGERILAEVPLVATLCADRTKLNGAQVTRLLHTALSGLDDVKKAAYFSLCQLPDGDMAGLPYSFEAAFGIWMTNAYPTSCGSAEGGDGQAIFEQLCRLNHACHPNTLLHWNDQLGAQTCHATRDIKKGDELTVAYWGDECCGEVRAERQKRTLERYGFECECATCRMTGADRETSDQRQRKLRVLSGLIARGSGIGSSRGGGGLSHERLCESVKALVELLRDEQMPASWAKDALLAATASAQLSGDAAGAVQWALAAAACAREAHGEDSCVHRRIVAQHGLAS